MLPVPFKLLYRNFCIRTISSIPTVSFSYAFIRADLGIQDDVIGVIYELGEWKGVYLLLGMYLISPK